ncbi:DUF1657 domain-containing protein [Peribacillus sp. Hz7]|uniref:DUF1657 domain-containing protein n=1 Tax=Peribacillus sp. Hz7 TaxID=3344873 RepID=UPI0035CB09FD
MTIASEVKQCLASLKGIEANLSSLAIRSQDSESQRTFHETMLIVNEVATDLQRRVGELEREEFQYKGF